jgi:hypothetical protein
MDTLLKEKIASIDLSKVKVTMQEPDGGAYSLETVNDLEIQYREFLYVAGTNDRARPTKEVDQMWHQHILDTRAYHEDCNRVFGKMIHHFHCKDDCGQGYSCWDANL